MAVLKTFKKRVADRRRLHLDYSRWLEDDEELTSFAWVITPVTVPPLVIDEWFFSPTHKEIVIYGADGLANTTYVITLTVTTDEGQTKLDDIGLKVKP